MNYTTNYHLPQWVETDRLLMDDFNDAYSAIDTALGGLREDVDTNDAAHASFGNCSLYTASYTGTGVCNQANPNAFTFPKAPAMVFLYSVTENILGFCAAGGMILLPLSGATRWLSTTWSADGKTVSWYTDHPNNQFNKAGTVYYILALVQAG